MKTRHTTLFGLAIGILMLVPILSYAQAEERLYLNFYAEPEQSFALEDLRTITFTEEAFTLRQQVGSALVLPYDRVSAITFSPQPPSATTEIEKSGVSIYQDADVLIVRSDTEILAVNLFSMQGALVARQASPGSLSEEIPLSSLPQGVYVVQVVSQEGFTSKKFIKQ